MRKYGFKLFSSNLGRTPFLIQECVDFAHTHDDVFVEMMIVPETTEADLFLWQQQLQDIEVRLHAPHHTMGFDAANKNLEAQNKDFMATALKAADIFDAKTIVVHAGCGHDKTQVNETIRQLKNFNDQRLVIENLPYLTNTGLALQANTATEMKDLMTQTNLGFCFDFSHAICAALKLNIDIDDQLSGFFKLRPTVYHLCDGDITKSQDLHLHYGDGNYDLKHFLYDYTADDAYITMETGKGFMDHSDLWVKDYYYLKSL